MVFPIRFVLLPHMPIFPRSRSSIARDLLSRKGHFSVPAAKGNRIGEVSHFMTGKLSCPVLFSTFLSIICSNPIKHAGT